MMGAERHEHAAAIFPALNKVQQFVLVTHRLTLRQNGNMPDSLEARPAGSTFIKTKGLVFTNHYVACLLVICIFHCSIES
jgi:hypothetical protein